MAVPPSAPPSRRREEAPGIVADDAAPERARTFSPQATDACKGAALLLLLWHHLFYALPGFGPLVYQTAHLAKVCVAMMVLLSGYGYEETVKRGRAGLFGFYQRRFVAIYANYWFVAAIFVPLGVLVMNRPLSSGFAGHAPLKFAVQMTGLHQFVFQDEGYNATWWYMSVILPLIALFPLVHVLLRKAGALVLAAGLGILLPDRGVVPVLNDWLLPFALGAYASQRGLVTACTRRLAVFGPWRFVLLAAAAAAVAVFRTRSPLLNGTKIDWLFGSLVILLVFEATVSVPALGGALAFLGRQLFNVFLFHTFVYFYFWRAFVYSFGRPLAIFAVLLALCVALSLVVDLARRATGLDRVVQRLRSLRVPPRWEISFDRDAGRSLAPLRGPTA